MCVITNLNYSIQCKLHCFHEETFISVIIAQATFIANVTYTRHSFNQITQYVLPYTHK